MYWLKCQAVEKPAVNFGLENPWYPGCHSYGHHGPEPLPPLPPLPSPLSSRLSKAGLSSAAEEELAQAGAAGFPLASRPGNPILSSFARWGSQRKGRGSRLKKLQACGHSSQKLEA